jgi:hypothetical protein
VMKVARGVAAGSAQGARQTPNKRESTRYFFMETTSPY